MTFDEFLEKGLSISKQANVVDSLHGYFIQSAPRLYHTLNHFGLLTNHNLGSVLDIGPFFGYTPFILKENSSLFTILEGDDPAVSPLLPIYENSQISVKYVDLFEDFGPLKTATHKLDLPSASFDMILCWETMEHFGFNPVKFVKELYRVLKPGGRACITVPNKDSFQNLAKAITGRQQDLGISSYFTHEDYQSAGKIAFYGFHWREYSPKEIEILFRRVGFGIKNWGGFTVFQGGEKLSTARRAARVASLIGSRLAPRYSTNVFVEAMKPLK